MCICMYACMYVFWRWQANNALGVVWWYKNLTVKEWIYFWIFNWRYIFGLPTYMHIMFFFSISSSFYVHACGWFLIQLSSTVKWLNFIIQFSIVTCVIFHFRFPVMLFYMCQCGFYIYSIAALLMWETRRKDFSVMMSHHVITVILIGYSYLSR